MASIDTIRHLNPSAESELPDSLVDGVLAQKDALKQHQLKVALDAQASILRQRELDLPPYDTPEAEELIRVHGGLVWLAVRKHPVLLSKLAIDDFKQQAYLGILDAAEKFDPEKGEFSTYAEVRMRQKLSRYLDETGSTIRVTTDTRQKLRDLDATTEAEALAKINETITSPFTRETIMAGWYATRHTVEIDPDYAVDGVDQMVHSLDSNDEFVSEVTPVAAEDRGFEELIAKLSTDKLLKEADLSAREIDILKASFGLSPFTEPQAYRKIAKDFGITHTRVGQIIRRSLAILKDCSAGK